MHLSTIDLLFQYFIACLAITGTIKGTSKTTKNNHPSYLSNIVPQRNFAFNTGNVGKVPLPKIKHNIFNITLYVNCY